MEVVECKGLTNHNPYGIVFYLETELCHVWSTSVNDRRRKKCFNSIHNRKIGIAACLWGVRSSWMLIIKLKLFICNLRRRWKYHFIVWIKCESNWIHFRMVWHALSILCELVKTYAWNKFLQELKETLWRFLWVHSPSR